MNVAHGRARLGRGDAVIGDLRRGAAAMQSSAISAGVTGKVSLCSRVVWLPVTAQERIVGFIVLSC